MTRTELLRRLSLGPGDRAMVLHADDVGLCEATVRGHAELSAGGAISSASAMVPSGWFPALADSIRGTGCDVGVHLTLNSEWRRYRLAPVVGAGAPSLVDEFGYFHALAAHTHRAVNAEEAEAELRAQVLRARAHGVDVTHIDSHMLTLLHPSLIDVYLRLSRELRLPSGLVRMDAPEIEQLCRISPAEAAGVHRRLARADAEGLVAFDAWAELPLNRHADRLACAQDILAQLPAGLSLFVCHPAVATDELRMIASDWAARAADYELLSGDPWRRAVEASGVKVVGMRAVRAAMFG